MNEDRLHFEYDRYYRLRNFQTIFFLFYTAIGAFLPRLFAFYFYEEGNSTSFSILFILFLISFTAFIGWTVILVWPKAIAFIDLPKTFYGDYYDFYMSRVETGKIETEDPEGKVQEFLQENYLEQLEMAVEANKSKNDFVNIMNKQTLLIGIAALLFYLASFVMMEGVKGNEDPAQGPEAPKSNCHESLEERNG